MITFVRLLKSSMSYSPLVLCVIAKMHTITTSKAWHYLPLDGILEINTYLSSLACSIQNQNTFLRVLHGSLVNCFTRKPGVLGSSCTRSSIFFFIRVSLGKTLQSPSLVLVKPRKDMNNVSCRCDLTEILLKAA